MRERQEQKLCHVCKAVIKAKRLLTESNLLLWFTTFVTPYVFLHSLSSVLELNIKNEEAQMSINTPECDACPDLTLLLFAQIFDADESMCYICEQDKRISNSILL